LLPLRLEFLHCGLLFGSYPYVETLARDWHNEGANVFVELSAAERKDASKALAIFG
jgi:hypothetical protein